MYVYVYDEFTNQKKYSKLLYKIENRLTDLGLNGWSVKTGISKNLQTALNDKIQQGAKTIVAIGNNKTIAQIINIVANSQSDDKHRLSLGIIPVGKNNNTIATALGIGDMDSACKILLARKVNIFTLGQINENFFLFNVTLLMTSSTLLEINNSYTLQSPTLANITIFNNPSHNNQKFFKTSITNKEGESSFAASSIFITNHKESIITDEALEIKDSTLIKPGYKTIKLITGKNKFEEV